jgi:hypothetical protein
VIPKRAVSLFQHLRDPDDLEVTMGVKGGGLVTPLGTIRPCGKEVPPKGP